MFYFCANFTQQDNSNIWLVPYDIKAWKLINLLWNIRKNENVINYVSLNTSFIDTLAPGNIPINQESITLRCAWSSWNGNITGD